MNTPLQQAAQAMIDRWDSTDWKDTPHTAHYVAALRKELDAELAQSVEPVEPFAYFNIGTEYHVKGKIIFHKGLTPNLEDRWWGPDTPLYLHQPQPQATTPAAPTLTETLAQQGIKLRTEFEPKQRDHIEDSLGMVGERAELIARLAKQWAELDPADPYRADIGQAVSMLEADGKQKETKNEQQVRSEVDAMGGRQPMEVSGDCSRDNFNGDDRALVASMVALLKLDAAGCLVPHGIGGYAQKLLQASITRLEADAQHANKPTGWDNGLSQDYCAEFGQWLASRPGARQQIKVMFDTSTPLQP